MFCLPEQYKVVQGLALEGAGAGATSLPISLKTVAGKLYVVCNVYPAGGAAMALVPQTDALVAFGSGAVLTNAVRIWANEDTVTSDRLVRQTAAVNFTTAADANPKLVIFEIDPADLAAGEDCFRISITNVPNGDAVAITYIFEPKYAACVGTVPTAITD
jgi:hypothetical protein